MNEYNIDRKMVRPSINNQKKYNKKYKRKSRIPQRMMVYLLAAGILVQGGRSIEKHVQKKIDDSRPSISSEINANADVELAVYEAALQTIRNLNLENSIDLKNTYKTNNKGYELDNYYLYQMALGNKEDFDAYSRLAFALPILNDKDIDKNSEIYLKAQDILENSAPFLMQLAEEISLDKLIEALDTVSEDSLTPEKLEEFKELKEMAESGNIQMRRTPIDKRYYDYVFYEKPDTEKGYGEKNITVLEAGKKSGKIPILETEDNRRLIDGFNAISDATKIRGDLLLSSQMYNSIVDRAYSDEEIAEARKDRLKTILKAANTLPIIDNREIDELDFEKGRIKEHDPEKEDQEKNFHNLIENDLNKTFAIINLKERTNESEEHSKDKTELNFFIDNSKDQDELDQDELEDEIEKDDDLDMDERDL